MTNLDGSSSSKHVRPSWEPGFEKGSLFGSTGVGPVRSPEAWEPAEYRGPLYPKPYNTPDLKLEPASVALCNKARRQWSKGNFGKAKESYEKARQLSPENPDFAFEEAQLLWNLRDEKAKDLLRESLQLQPQHNDKARIGLTILNMAHDLTTALDEFGKVEWDSPKTVRYVARILRDNHF